MSRKQARNPQPAKPAGMKKLEHRGYTIVQSPRTGRRKDVSYLPYPRKVRSGRRHCTAMVFLLAVAILVAAMAAPSIGSRLLTFCTTTLLATATISNMKGEKKNVQH